MVGLQNYRLGLNTIVTEQCDRPCSSNEGRNVAVILEPNQSPQT